MHLVGRTFIYGGREYQRFIAIWNVLGKYISWLVFEWRTCAVSYICVCMQIMAWWDWCKFRIGTARLTNSIHVFYNDIYVWAEQAHEGWFNRNAAGYYHLVSENLDQISYLNARVWSFRSPDARKIGTRALRFGVTPQMAASYSWYASSGACQSISRLRGVFPTRERQCMERRENGLWEDHGYIDYGSWPE